MEFQLHVVRIWVSDWERALRFYTETLGIPTTFRSDELGWAQLDTGTANLALERVAPDDVAAATFIGRHVGASLLVSDIAATHETLVRRGVHFPMPPTRMDWGGTLANLRDPDGNVLTLLQSPAA
jgi:catechol 2,3-dioxygenase-like lactoylglutathione lyase family enzyme